MNIVMRRALDNLDSPDVGPQAKRAIALLWFLRRVVLPRRAVSGA